jgi:hypothetical protein
MVKRIPWRRALPVFLILIILAGSGFVIWATTVPEIMPEAKTALTDDSVVDVTEAEWIEFMPRDQQTSAGYILYPGGKVLAEAYAPLARAIAERGYFVAIVHAPLNLAIFDTTVAHPVIVAHPEIKFWAVGGHSLGGVAASMYARDNAGEIGGLVLMASIPFPGADLQKRTDLAVLSIYGTRDGRISPVDVQKSAAELPEDTVFVSIEGGNHGQFGYYGTQPGDNEAAILRTDQQAQMIDATIALLEHISRGESG